MQKNPTPFAEVKHPCTRACVCTHVCAHFRVCTQRSKSLSPPGRTQRPEAVLCPWRPGRHAPEGRGSGKGGGSESGGPVLSPRDDARPPRGLAGPVVCVVMERHPMTVTPAAAPPPAGPFSGPAGEHRHLRGGRPSPAHSTHRASRHRVKSGRTTRGRKVKTGKLTVGVQREPAGTEVR